MLGLATLIVHDDHATVTRKLGPARDLTSGWFGEQKTYFHKVGVELIAIELAAKTLEQAPLGLDLVLGDGCETNQKTAKQRLDKLGPPHRAARDPDRDPSPPTGPRGSPGSIASSLTLGASHMTRGPGVPVLRNTAHFHLCRVEA